MMHAQLVDLDEGGRARRLHRFFTNPIKKTPQGKTVRFAPELDDDGLPPVGTRLTKGDAFYSYVDGPSHRPVLKRYSYSEDAYVDQVRVIGSTTGSDSHIKMVSFKLRINRNPIIGDKFSSRHGQKGVLGKLWPTIDMPFTESGLTPDVIINPHAFPSRMTIGMLVESMAAKSGSLHGIFQDATPFKYARTHSLARAHGRTHTLPHGPHPPAASPSAVDSTRSNEPWTFSVSNSYAQATTITATRSCTRASREPR